MPATCITRHDFYRIPDGVEFPRWDGGEEWVIYHSGTGETLRLSDAAVAILDLLQQIPSLDTESLVRELAGMVDGSSSIADLYATTAELMRVLLQHDCIEKAPCA